MTSLIQLYYFCWLTSTIMDARWILDILKVIVEEWANIWCQILNYGLLQKRNYLFYIPKVLCDNKWGKKILTSSLALIFCRSQGQPNEIGPSHLQIHFCLAENRLKGAGSFILIFTAVNKSLFTDWLLRNSNKRGAEREGWIVHQHHLVPFPLSVLVPFLDCTTLFCAVYPNLIWPP